MSDVARWHGRFLERHSLPQLRQADMIPKTVLQLVMPHLSGCLLTYCKPLNDIECPHRLMTLVPVPSRLEGPSCSGAFL